jgi:beta-lactam-binding protein with PASTA domain
MTVPDAITTLQAAGLEPAIIGKGKKITGQSPPAGTVVPPGTRIKLNTT